MTEYSVAGFDRAQALYEFASACGLHAGSMDQLVRFSVELQQRALSARALEHMADNARELGLDDKPQCWCQTCRPITLHDMRMVLCPTCGNKRCPRATDHRLECTKSNEPGQPGSSYGIPLEEVE